VNIQTHTEWYENACRQ